MSPEESRTLDLTQQVDNLTAKLQATEGERDHFRAAARDWEQRFHNVSEELALMEGRLQAGENYLNRALDRLKGVRS